MDRAQEWLGRCESCRNAAEDVRDLWTEQRQNGDNDDRHQNEDQRVLNQALTFLTGQIHFFHLLSLDVCLAELPALYHKRGESTIIGRRMMLARTLS